MFLKLQLFLTNVGNFGIMNAVGCFLSNIQNKSAIAKMAVWFECRKNYAEIKQIQEKITVLLITAGNSELAIK